MKELKAKVGTKAVLQEPTRFAKEMLKLAG